MYLYEKIFKKLIYQARSFRLIVRIILIMLMVTAGEYTIMKIHSEHEKVEMIKLDKEHQKVRYDDKDHYIKTIIAV